MSHKILLFNVLLVVSLLFAPVAQAQTPESPDEPGVTIPRAFFPRLAQNGYVFSLSGRVTDTGNNAIPSVKITDEGGGYTYTDSAGYYKLVNVTPGHHELHATKPGWLFQPGELGADVPGNTTNLNFTGYQSCQQLISNSGMEKDSAWSFPNTAYPAKYSNSAAHSGTRSIRTGIIDPNQRKESYSDAYQVVNIPSGSTSVTLRMWLYPLSGITAGNAPSAPADAPEPGTLWAEAPLGNDAQYVMLIDPDDGDILETLLWWSTRNDQKWVYAEFNLKAYAGQSVRIQFGSYNNNTGGVTAMYVDDFAVDACPSGASQGQCYNLITNSGFEYKSDWGIPNTAYPADYSTLRKHNGSWSMRTGITSSADNEYSYSDAYQDISIPTNASSAILNLWLWPQSGESVTATPDAPRQLPTLDSPWTEGVLSTDAPDAQYVLVINPANGNILEYLLWWEPNNAQTWTYKKFDLMAYKGKTIRIQFGTYNDGKNGITAMYVDDVYVDVCTPTTPPPPPPGCNEILINGGFENDQAWDIPITAYSAGYSTYRYRSGARSLRTGIVYLSHNTYSYSDARQMVSLPIDLTSAKLSFYIYPMSGEPTMQGELDQPLTPYFGVDALDNSDTQYALILDQYGNWIDTLLWQRTNDQKWLYKQFDLSDYAGETIKIQFGSYNDGYDGVTAMYVDDASLKVCR